MLLLMKVLAALSVTPSSRLASAAPGMLPRPPRITTMKALSSGVAPMNGDTENSGAISAPAMAARPTPMPKPSGYISRARTPCAVAISVSCTTARKARPVRVWPRNT
ncbi:hypothetical protein D9M73_288770 [compost metagenome]